MYGCIHTDYSVPEMAQKVLEALVAIVTDHTIFDLSSLVKTNQRFSTVREKRFSSVCVAAGREAGLKQRQFPPDLSEKNVIFL